MNNKKFYKQLGKRLRAARENAGITQAAAAKACGYSHRSSIAHIESGYAQIPIETLRKMADLYDIGVDKLLFIVETN